ADPPPLPPRPPATRASPELGCHDRATTLRNWCTRYAPVGFPYSAVSAANDPGPRSGCSPSPTEDGHSSLHSVRGSAPRSAPAHSLVLAGASGLPPALEDCPACAVLR